MSMHIRIPMETLFYWILRFILAVPIPSIYSCLSSREQMQWLGVNGPWFAGKSGSLFAISNCPRAYCPWDFE
jgi:hypothetical protein